MNIRALWPLLAVVTAFSLIGADLLYVRHAGQNVRELAREVDQSSKAALRNQRALNVCHDNLASMHEIERYLRQALADASTDLADAELTKIDFTPVSKPHGRMFDR